MEECPYFRTCGGCQQQHIPYEQQVDNKKQRLSYLLKEVYEGDIDVFVGNAYGYRNRMDFITTQKAIGFRQEDPKKIVDVQRCPISESRLNNLLTEVRKFLENNKRIEMFDKIRKVGCMKYAVIRVGDTACISFMLNEDYSRLTDAIEVIRVWAQQCSAENVVITYSNAQSDDSVSLECFAVKGSEQIETTLCGKKFVYHSQGFFQNNTKVAEMMVQHVRNIMEKNNFQNQVLIDAYGGVGTFGIILADMCKQVISIESFPGCTESCEKNIALNNITNMQAINEDAGNMKKLQTPIDAVYLLDPPRSGLGDKMMKFLLEQKPEHVIYVSCNPNQLAKELVLLKRTYSVKSAALADMFPQTNHIEAIVLLKRNE